MTKSLDHRPQVRLVTKRNLARKSWIPTEDDLLQKVTTQALIHEISLQQMHGVQEVVPWFLKTMPVIFMLLISSHSSLILRKASYFRQVPEEMRKSHLKAIAAIRDLKQSDLRFAIYIIQIIIQNYKYIFHFSLKIVTVVNEGLTEITLIQTIPKTGLLFSQMQTLPIPPDTTLSRVRVFSSADGELALNIFTYEKPSHQLNSMASVEDSNIILSFIDDLKNGVYNNDMMVPKDHSMFSYENILSYISRCTSSYVKLSNPRRFLIQRQLYEKVNNTDSVEVHIEPYTGLGGPPSTSAAWITIAAGNVVPEILLRVTSLVLSRHEVDIYRAHLDIIKSTGNNNTSESSSSMRESVTMLRLLISPDPVSWRLVAKFIFASLHSKYIQVFMFIGLKYSFKYLYNMYIYV